MYSVTYKSSTISAMNLNILNQIICMHAFAIAEQYGKKNLDRDALIP